jgi:gluconate kinase
MFNILGKLSEVLYEVDCGRNNEPQIIHCDRLKRKVKQRLRGESERDTYPVEIDSLLLLREEHINYVIGFKTFP